MAELSQYENYAMMIQHCILAIQQRHSLAVKIEELKKKLSNKTKQVAKLLSSLNKAEARIRSLQDKAKAAQLAQSKAEDSTEAAENVVVVAKDEAQEAKEKESQAQIELQMELATKAAEIKAADEKAYAEEAANVRDAYKKQVNEACNKGYTLGWMSALKELVVPNDSPLCDASQLTLPFSPTLSQSEDEAEEEKEIEADKDTVADVAQKIEAAGAKSLTLDKQAEKAAKKSTQLFVEAKTPSIVKAGQSAENPQ
ncbi:uncharacterized protein LOC114296591 [Camellia sinensis]|uniref:uncharacterized protein LOC114296591 n=1 Tax=Camellia sinensis TaxID=4442 RepID=UPI0010357F67|nr:uncharacterized protein LOC114296591 [Camellia sinensis]